MMSNEPRSATSLRDSERLLRALSVRGLTYWCLSTVLLLGIGLFGLAITLIDRD